MSRWPILLLLCALAGCSTVPRPAPMLSAPVAVEEPEEPTELPPARAIPTTPSPGAGTETTKPAPPPRLRDGAALFERMASGFSAPVCVRGPRNQAWRRRYAGHPDTLARQWRETMPLMAWVVEQVDAQGLPMEFALIPIVESGYRPDARGPGGPAGLWQMISSTARLRGVVVGPGYDGRLAPVDATRAALDHLALLQAEFGEWRATAMAYNAGEGRLRRAFERSGDRRVSGERRLPSGLSNITYDYVAKLHALACLITEPARHGLTLPTDTFLPLDERKVPADLQHLDAVAAHWDLPMTTLRQLNPAYGRGALARQSPRRLLVPAPADGAPAEPASVAAAQGAEPPRAGPPVEVRRYTVQAGDTLWRIARRFGTTVRALAEANGMAVEQALRIGRELRVPD
jgi:membrane-bound lytic murein transglycosylase D